MKRIYNTMVAILIATTTFAQVPQLLGYQAVVRNSSDQLIANKQVGMKISILQSTANGASVYTETQTPTTNVNGLVSIQIGEATGFSTINWSNGPYFIKTETDISGGTNYTITGTSQLLSVPYALAAGCLVINKNSKSFDTYMKDDGTYVGLPRITVQQPFDSVPTVTDIDDNVYGTVKIGTQVWMTSNLKTTRYRNGDAIPNVTDNTVWKGLISGAQCTYKNTIVADSINTFGRLYNFYAVADIRNIAPIGWHVPSNAEWTTLTTYLGSMAGGRLKEVGTTHWISTNTDGLNDSKFSALPGGRFSGSTFFDVGNYGYWWSSTESGLNYAYRRRLDSMSSNMSIFDYPKQDGYSIRCIKD